MRHYLIAPVVALGMLTGSQLALAEQDPFVSMGLFFTPLSEVDTNDPAIDKVDGNGFGARVEVGGSLHGYGEYSQSSLDNNIAEMDFSDTRLGVAYRSHMDFGYVLAAVEYASLDFDTAKEDGLGAHLGLGFNATDAVSLYGKVGMLALDNLDGPEIRIGAHANINEGTRVFAEYRTAMLSDAGLDVDVNDLRIGISFGF